MTRGTADDLIQFINLLGRALTRGKQAIWSPLRKWIVAIGITLAIATLLIFFGLVSRSSGAFSLAALMLAFVAIGVGVIGGALSAMVPPEPAGQGRFKRGIAGFRAVAVAGCFACLMLAWIPWYNNPGAIPIIVLASLTLTVAGVRVLTGPVAMVVAGILLFSATGSLLFPTRAQKLLGSIIRGVEGGAGSVAIACDDVLADRVAYFDGGEPIYWVGDGRGPKKLYDGPGWDPVYNTPLRPVDYSDIEAITIGCEDTRARAMADSLAETERLKALLEADSVEREAELVRLRNMQIEDARQESLLVARRAVSAESAAAARKHRRDSLEADAYARFDASAVDIGSLDSRLASVLNGRNAVVHFSTSQAEWAGQIASVLRANGMIVQAVLGRPGRSDIAPWEINYSPSDLRVATAAQAAVLPLRRMSITSNARLRGLVLWFD